MNNSSKADDYSKMPALKWVEVSTREEYLKNLKVVLKTKEGRACLGYWMKVVGVFMDEEVSSFLQGKQKFVLKLITDGSIDWKEAETIFSEEVTRTARRTNPMVQNNPTLKKE